MIVWRTSKPAPGAVGRSFCRNPPRNPSPSLRPWGCWRNSHASALSSSFGNFSLSLPVFFEKGVGHPDAKEVGVGNPAEENDRMPDASTLANRPLPEQDLFCPDFHG